VELAALFEGELNPVAAKAQRKVPIPEGLDLDAWINEPSTSDLEEEEGDSTQNDNQIFDKNEHKNKPPLQYTSMSSSNYGGGSTNYNGSGESSTYNNGGQQPNLGARKIAPELSQEDLAKYKETRKIQLDSNPFYIKGSSNVKVIFMEIINVGREVKMKNANFSDF
jgi:AP-3 complex subunit delta-1